MKYIYIDMDGVLADFEREENAVERFAVEKGFFFKLKPFKKNVNAVRELITKENVKVYILSASPNDSADQDKIMWLKKYIPNFKNNHIILCRNGQKKVDFMKSENGVLFDDYGKNLNEWKVKENNKGWKIRRDGDLPMCIKLELSF